MKKTLFLTLVLVLAIASVAFAVTGPRGLGRGASSNTGSSSSTGSGWNTGASNYTGAPIVNNEHPPMCEVLAKLGIVLPAAFCCVCD